MKKALNKLILVQISFLFMIFVGSFQNVILSSVVNWKRYLISESWIILEQS